MLVLAATAAAQNRSNDSDYFSRLFPSRVKTVVKASYDPDDREIAPSQGNDDGFSGQNHCESYRAYENGTAVAMLAHFEGRGGVLGLFFRNFWSDAAGQTMWPGENNRTRMWVDNVLVQDLPLRDCFRNPWDPRGQVPPFAGAFTGNRSGGHVTHAQLRWQDSFKLGLDDDSFFNAARFHRVSATLASPEGELPVPDLMGWEYVARHRGQWPHRTAHNPITMTLPVAGGGGVASLLLTGPSTLLELTVKVPQRIDWKGLRVRFTWDQAAQPQVEAPLRLLGAMVEPPHSFPVNGLLYNNDGDRRITCYFPMHFARSARLEFINDNSQAVPLRVTYALRPGAHPQPWGHFHAIYRAAVTSTRRPFDGPKLTDMRGTLRMVLLEDTMDSSGRIPNMTTAHLEGDLCIRINGNRGDDHSFAATETSVGRWGWYLTPADQPFVQDTSFNSGIMLAQRTPTVAEARRIMGSTFVFDPVHFVSGLDMLLEHGVQNTANADYQLLAFVYAEPGAARRQIAEIDVGNTSPTHPQAEPQHNVQYTAWSSYTQQGHFMRDQFYGTPMVTDSVRHIRDFLRFEVVRTDQKQEQRGVCVGLRLDRLGGASLGVCQADVWVNGQRAGLLHVYTHNMVFPWKEGGECEVELPHALTDGLRQFTVEIRPRLGSDALKIARVFVYEYLK